MRAHFSVRVFDGGDVDVLEGAVDEALDQTGLAHAAGAEDDDAVVVALLRHLGEEDEAWNASSFYYVGLFNASFCLMCYYYARQHT